MRLLRTVVLTVFLLGCLFLLGSCTWSDEPIVSPEPSISMFEKLYPVHQGNSWLYLRTGKVFRFGSSPSQTLDLVTLSIGGTHQPIFGKGSAFFLSRNDITTRFSVNYSLCADSAVLSAYQFDHLFPITSPLDRVQTYSRSGLIDSMFVNVQRGERHSMRFNIPGTSHYFHIDSVSVGQFPLSIFASSDSLWFNAPDTLADMAFQVYSSDRPGQFSVHLHIGNFFFATHYHGKDWMPLLLYGKRGVTTLVSYDTVITLPVASDTIFSDTIRQSTWGSIGDVEGITTNGGSYQARRLAVTTEYTESIVESPSSRFFGVSLRREVTAWMVPGTGMVKLILNEYAPNSGSRGYVGLDDYTYVVSGIEATGGGFFGNFSSGRVTFSGGLGFVVDRGPLTLVSTDTLSLLSATIQ